MDNSSGQERSGNFITNSYLEANGDIIIGGRKIINIYQFADFEVITQQIRDKEELYAEWDEMLTVLRKKGGDEDFESRLKKKLTSLNKDLKTLRERKLNMQKEILRLAETFTEIEINSDRLKKAKDLFDNGRFRDADRILNEEELSAEQELLLHGKQLLAGRQQEQEEKLKDNASSYLLKAQLRATDFDNPHRVEETVRFFEQSIRSGPAFGNLYKLAYFLQGHNQLAAAEQYFLRALDLTGIHAREKADVLHNLGIIHQDRRAFGQALEYYHQSIEAIKEEGAEYTPDTLVRLAGRYNTIGSLHQDFGQYAEAADFLNQALDMLNQGPEEGAPYILEAKADLHNNFGALYEAEERWADALAHYRHALKWYRKLERGDEGEHADKKAFLLSNLGALYQEMNKKEEALDCYREAFAVYRQLADKNPEKYNHDLGVVHINLGVYYYLSVPDREQSVSHAKDGISYIGPYLEEMPALQEYVDRGWAVLRAWSA